MAKLKVTEPGGLQFAGATRSLVGAIPGQPEDTKTHEAGCSCGFRSSGWAKANQAHERLVQHMAEHESGGETVTEELVDFKERVGFDVGIAPVPSLEPFDDTDDNPVLAAAPADENEV